MAKETPYREMDSRGFRHSNSVHEKRLEATMITYCDINTWVAEDDGKPIAWQPLPKPYREESEVEE